jgi:hypothetical protein
VISLLDGSSAAAVVVGTRPLVGAPTARSLW